MRLGVHVPIAGGLLKAVDYATRLSCTTMQIFSRSPRGGPAPVRSAEELAQFDMQRRHAGIEPLAVHAPYIINLASPEAAMWTQSLRLYREEYQRAAQLQAQYLVTHVGSHRGSGEALGIARVAQALNDTLKDVDRTVTILLENTAGAGQGLGDQFDQLAAIRSGVRRFSSVGVCLDTAHLFAAGHPIHTAEGLEAVLGSCDRLIGLEHVKMIHLNDSKVPFEARVDRHWHIGQGHIGLEAFGRIINHPRVRDIPFILETPKSTDAEDQRNLGVVRGLRTPARRAPHAQCIAA